MKRKKRTTPSSSRSAPRSVRTLGAIDLHFHGAFGIDLMTASPAQMDELSRRLWKQGIAGFCATTLSVPEAELLESVGRMGAWIRSKSASGAIPLGIHLEGPFISPQACGAHPPSAIRPLDFDELERLWEASQETLKILTIAPEQLDSQRLARLVAWCKKRTVILSLGHSRATEQEAHLAFDAGFSGVTHAWNALHFHQRSPGVLGAALGRPDVYVELILDQVHVAPTVIRWTLDLHRNRTCFVSDCVPAAATDPGSWHPFGSLKIQFDQGACRVANGSLAGGGVLLPEAFIRWLQLEGERQGVPIQRLFKENVNSLTLTPLKALRLPKAVEAKLLKNKKVAWKFGPKGKCSVNSSN